MMKKISILALIATFFASCDLDRTPYDGLTEEQQFSSLQGFESAVKGMYAGFMNIGYFGQDGHLISSPDILSDNLTFNPQGRLTQDELFEWRFIPNDEVFPIYEVGYKIISRANSILDNIDKIAKSESRDRIQAEALAVRALVHFDIARLHCKIPTQSSDALTSLGIYYSKTFEPTAKPRRAGTTVQGVYDAVIADFNQALSLIGDTKIQGRLNKAAINGLLARVYLHYGKYSDAVTHADKAIEDGTFKVAPRSEFANVWTDDFSDNVLFKILITEKNDIAIGNTYGQRNAAGSNRAEYVCAYDFYNMFKDSDIRKTTTISTGVYARKTYNSISKYFGRTTGTKNLVDGKYLRLEEVYLTKAEALYRIGGREAEALAALDEVRKNRYENFVSGAETGTNLLDAILLERRFELSFEGDRFFTLKRLALPLQRGSYGEFSDGTGTPAKVLTYPADGFRWQLPIPRGAIDANPDLANDQNPGYGQ